MPPGTSRFLSESDSLDVLAAAGLPVVAHCLCDTIDDLIAAVRRFGTPVVVKACSSQLPHKSDYDLVVLNVDSEAAACAAGALQRRTRALGVPLDGILVAETGYGRHELMLGARVDATFGPVLLVGDGGRCVEALRDTAVLLPPVSAQEVRDALSSLRVWPWLHSAEGDAVDVDAFCAAAVSLGRYITAAADAVASVDVNPVLVGDAGHGIIVVDALIERAAR
ncbi:MAG: acetate--CoA ligase family protein [Vicinamibacterales bacterium]